MKVTTYNAIKKVCKENGIRLDKKIESNVTFSQVVKHMDKISIVVRCSYDEFVRLIYGFSTINEFNYHKGWMVEKRNPSMGRSRLLFNK